MAIPFMLKVSAIERVAFMSKGSPSFKKALTILAPNRSALCLDTAEVKLCQISM